MNMTIPFISCYVRGSRVALYSLVPSLHNQVHTVPINKVTTLKRLRPVEQVWKELLLFSEFISYEV
jgi:hypothetical protein